MSDCIFCKLAAGEIPTSTLYEDDCFKVIMDTSPATKGHAIILPKVHADNIYELPDEYASKIFVVAKKVATAMKEELHCDGVNILQNNGEIAGQTVFHLHMHVIPRYEGDRVRIKLAEGEEPEYDLKQLAESIGKRIK